MLEWTGEDFALGIEGFKISVEKEVRDSQMGVSQK
jgi:hypothetical protein